MGEQHLLLKSAEYCIKFGHAEYDGFGHVLKLK